MRGGLLANKLKRITRSIAAVADAHTFPWAGKTEPFKDRKAWFYRSSLGQEAAHLEELPGILREHSLADWWDTRLSKPHLKYYRGLRCKELKFLWLNLRHKHTRIHAQLGMIEVGSRTIPKTRYTSVQRSGALAATRSDLEVHVCRNLHENGLSSDAVHALEVLVRRGYRAPSNLFYRVLRRCIRDKDLTLGRRVHALTVESGYEGDALLVTQLIVLYASHGRLEEARDVFTKVATPNAYNWATIIFAYARHGCAASATEAIRLYRQMCELTTVKPDHCVFSAVLKACAAAKDLVSGKMVHEHVLASSLKADRSVEAGIVNMYAKCGSVGDARRYFDELSEKSVVAWTALIAGYSQKGMAQEAVTLYRTMQKQGLAPDSVAYVCLLQACASLGRGALVDGKQVHAEIAERGLEEGVVVGGSLVNMYVKCGSLEEARIVFDKLPERNVVAWNVMIAGYAKQGMCEEAILLYRRMQNEGFVPDSVTYVCLLQACGNVGVAVLKEGKELHADIKARGLHEDLALGSSLLNMYVKCGSIEDARRLFGNLPKRNIVTWNAMIAGYAQQGMSQDALRLYRSMRQEGCTSPNFVTYISLLQACASIGAGGLDDGKMLHAAIRKVVGLQEDAVLCTSLVNMYVKCGSLDDARELFDKLSVKNVVSWTTMIAGYARQGLGQEALRVYRSMQQEGLTHPNVVTYACLLQACANIGDLALHEGQQLHAEIKQQGLTEDSVLGGCLVNMYAKCSSLQDARALFDTLSERNVVAWNALLSGFNQKGMGGEALKLFSRMQQELVTPDCVTYVALLQACASVGVRALNEGKQLHASITKQGLQDDLALGGSLVNMYTKCGRLEDARRLFDKLTERNIEAWNAMIVGYVQQEMGWEALSLSRRMHQEGLVPNSATYVCLLQACTSVGVEALGQGKELHGQIVERGLEIDAAIGGCLVTMYAKCSTPEEARTVFDKLTHRGLITWTVMIAEYVQHGMGQDALSLYSRMQYEGLTPDPVTYVCLLQACAAVPALPVGQQLHAEIRERGIAVSAVVGAALVNMYAKCGSMCESQRVFDSLRERSIEAWGALISGYAHEGSSQNVFELLHSMTLKGIQPNEIIILSVLTVCSHVGLVGEGRQYFKAMTTDYGISANMEHYRCMVDLLGRAGHLGEALRMVKSMPFAPTSVVWRTLLGACRKWKNVEIAEEALRCAVAAEKKDAAPYALMSNIYASRHMWDASNEMQGRRMKLGTWETPSESWFMDTGGEAHSFVVGSQQLPDESKDGFAQRQERSRLRDITLEMTQHVAKALTEMTSFYFTLR